MEQNGENSRLYKEWRQQYTLPNEVDATKLKSLLDKSGTLRIEAPVSNAAEDLPKEIPIDRD